jgi:hypothetical protein
MRFRAQPSNKPSPAQRLGVSYNHVLANRALLLWCHLLLGTAATLIYLSTLDIRNLNWMPGRGYNNSLVVTLRCIPVIFPYLISVAFSRRRVTAARAGPWVFALILVAGTGATGYFYLTRYEQTAIDTLSAILLQTSVYVLAAILLLRRDP